MTHGKNICNQLKEVRKRIAEENDIPLEIEECTYKGECRGTCPRCEAEVRYLENALADRLRLGKVATVAGLALGLAATTAQAQTPVQSTPIPDSITRHENLVEGEIDEEDNVFIHVETDPEFPGGIEALYKFIQDNLKYPQLALENGIQGKVYVTFVVDTTGEIINPRILRDIGGGCGAAAIRIVKSMPRWTPGKISGKVVPVQFNLPITFTLPADRPRVIEGMAPAVQLETIDTTPQIEVDNPHSPTQQMEREGVKVIVR